MNEDTRTIIVTPEKVGGEPLNYPIKTTYKIVDEDKPRRLHGKGVETEIQKILNT